MCRDAPPSRLPVWPRRSAVAATTMLAFHTSLKTSSLDYPFAPERPSITRLSATRLHEHGEGVSHPPLFCSHARLHKRTQPLLCVNSSLGQRARRQFKRHSLCILKLPHALPVRTSRMILLTQSPRYPSAIAPIPVGFGMHAKRFETRQSIFSKSKRIAFG